MDMAYQYNPDLLPQIAPIAQQVFQNAHLATPPALGKVLSEVPLGQPVSPFTGGPIGMRMPGAPTTPTRSQAQTAARTLQELPRIREEVTNLAQYLGPGEGRKNIGFLLGRVGTTGDKTKDQTLSQLRTDMRLLSSAAARFHLNSVRAMDEIAQGADLGKDSASAILGFMDSIQYWANRAAQQQAGFGEAGKPINISPLPGEAAPDINKRIEDAFPH
jgi:hypothetical protein